MIFGEACFKHPTAAIATVAMWSPVVHPSVRFPCPPTTFSYSLTFIDYELKSSVYGCALFIYWEALYIE
jgi:hypothetical protein